MIGICCDSYTEERLALASLMEQSAPLADASNLWISGAPAADQFLFIAKWLRERIQEEAA